MGDATGGYVYVGEVPGERPPQHYTPRVIAAHPDAMVPVEARFIHWYPT
jgi:starch phosphorylase